MKLPELKPWQWFALGGAGIVVATALFRRRGTIYTIVFENKGRDEVIGNSDAPFLNSMANQYKNLTNYSSPYHPSLPNYIVMTSGSTNGIIDDVGFRIPGNENIAVQMDAGGINWRAYGESMPSPCFASSTNLYAVRHMPFMYYDYVRNDSNYCANRVVPYDQFFADSGYRYQWITPNIINDMHDGTVAQGDAWANANVPAIMSSPGYLAGGAIFILFDESEGGESTMPAIVISESLKAPGTPDNTRYDHTSYLAGVQDLLGLPRLATTVGVPSLAELFR